MADTTYNVYLDPYGYLIGIEEYSAASNYLFITGYDLSSSSIAASTVTATAIFTDGTKETIKVNAERGEGSNFNTSGGNPIVNTWYTYSVNDAGVYTLNSATWVHDTDTATINSASVGLHALSGKYYYGNNDTNYIFIDKDNGLKTLGQSNNAAIYKVGAVITGVKNVNIDVHTNGLDSYGSYALYNSQGYIIAAVVVGENKGLAANYAYVISGNPNVETIKSDSQGYWYWGFNVITKDDGITTKTVKGAYGELRSIIATSANGLYEFTYDAEGYVVGADDVVIDSSEHVNAPANIYQSGNIASTLQWTTTNVLKTDGETLNDVAADGTMTGFALAAGYDIYTIEYPDGKATTQDWDGNAKAAVASLVLNDIGTPKEITALLNSNGEATMVIIRISTAYYTNYQGDYGSSGNVTSMTASYTTGAMTVNLVGPGSTDVNTVELTMITGGVSTPMGSYQITGTSGTVSISLASGVQYLVRCGDQYASFTAT